MKVNVTKAGLKYGYRSGLEETIANSLTKAGVDFGFETCKIAYKKPATDHMYTPDFVLSKSNGETMFIETKGRLVQADRKKHTLIKKQHPQVDIRFVFQYAKGKIYKGSKTTYAMWADKLKIKWAQGSIPQEWLDE